MAQPVLTRQELQRELQALLESSKTQVVPSPPVSGALINGTPEGSFEEGTARRSSDKLQKHPQKTSNEMRHSAELTGVTGKSITAGAAAKGTTAAAAPESMPTGILSWEQKWPQGDHKTTEEVKSSAGRQWMPWLSLRSIGIALKKHPSIWISSLLVFLILAIGGIIGVVAVASNETYQRHQAAEGAAINAAVAFERQLAQMFGPLLSLATIIRFNPDYKKVNASFDTIAQELLQQMPIHGAVTTLIAAPQGVLRNFYPLEGYCQDHCDNININLFKNPERRDVALKTVREGVLTMQGPMTLSQGYFGVVGRQPIFIKGASPNETWGAPDGPAYNCSICYNETSHERFWGFVNAVINFETLATGQDSRLKDLKTMGYRYEMYMEKDGERIEIARSSDVPQDPVSSEVHVPQNTWTLDVSPEQGWVPVWRAPILAVVVLISALIGLLLCAILVSARLQAYLKSANDALAEEKTRMDVLLARQYNLISCVLNAEGNQGGEGRNKSIEHTTLARIEDMRRDIGVTSGSSGVDELQLIELMDEGTYGKVFKGLWRGSVVAVKTMVLPAKMSGQKKRERMAIMEAAISSAIQHPNIVQTYTYIIKPSSTTVAHANSTEEGSSSVLTGSDVAAAFQGNLESPEANAPTVHNFEVSLVLEYCDWGSLRTALDAGAFFTKDNTLNYAAILDTAADVARAMVHLHKNNVLHSDLKCRNVLIKSDASGRGCIAKVADFGLAVRMDHTDTHVSAFQGTMSHMAPEALLHGRISKAGDVYSFGITLWELYTGGNAYQGVPRALLGHNVAVKGMRPELPPYTPADFCEIVQSCWAHEAEKRPTFEQILSKLVAMRAAINLPHTPPMVRYEMQAKAKTASKRAAKGDLAAPAKAQVPPAAPAAHSYYLEMSTESDGSGSNGPPPFTTMGRTLGTTCGLETIHDTEADEGNLREGGAQSAASGGGDAAPTAAVASAPQERVQDAKERDIEQGL